MRPVATPAARNTDPLTSHQAAAHVTASGSRGAQQALAIKAVQLHPGLTSLELGKRTGIDRYMLARRLPECVQGGGVRRGEARACRISGRQAATWWPPGSVEQLRLAP